jgi:hypothetical protein
MIIQGVGVVAFGTSIRKSDAAAIAAVATAADNACGIFFAGCNALLGRGRAAAAMKHIMVETPAPWSSSP